MDAHIALGCEPTWSCAPYQAGHRPAFGSHVAWAESNAIAFVNSVLGARSDRYGDFLDLSAAVTGRVPFGGLHHDEARKAVLVLDFPRSMQKYFLKMLRGLPWVCFLVIGLELGLPPWLAYPVTLPMVALLKTA